MKKLIIGILALGIVFGAYFATSGGSSNQLADGGTFTILGTPGGGGGIGGN